MRKTTLTEQMYSVKVGFEINPTKTLGIMKRGVDETVNKGKIRSQSID